MQPGRRFGDGVHGVAGRAVEEEGDSRLNLRLIQIFYEIFLALLVFLNMPCAQCEVPLTILGTSSTLLGFTNPFTLTVYIMSSFPFSTFTEVNI